MAKLKKSNREKPADDKDLPKVVEIDARMSKRWGEGTCVIPALRAGVSADAGSAAISGH